MRSLLCMGAALIASIAGSKVTCAVELDRPVAHGPPITAAPFSIWTGCFVGGNGGFASARWQLTGNFPVPASTRQTNEGFALGGQLGCDYQLGAWTLGVQGMFDGTDLKSTFSQLANVSAPVSVKEPWFTTATGRIGYAIAPAFLAYGRGGTAWSQGRTGWTAGVGLDWKCLPNLSLFVEYDHLGLGTKNIALATVPPVSAAYKVNIETVLVGFNYRFNIPSSVTTRY
jgi:outer membrane immunogenic protein